MTLTYRGQKYEQAKQAAPQQNHALAYRGIRYQKLSSLSVDRSAPPHRRGFFVAINPPG